MRNERVKNMAVSAMIAALYFALSLPFMTFNFGAVQLRVSEALTLLPIFAPQSAVGLTVGCVLVNTMGAATGMNVLGPLDIIIGSAATGIAALMTWQLRQVRIKGLPIAAAIPPILVNGLVVGLELTLVLGGGWNWGFFAVCFAQVAVGEAIACLCLGVPLVTALERTGAAEAIFGKQKERARV